MELRTIGQVGVFAIEHGTSYEDGPDLLRLRIRIGDAVLGTFETSTYLPVFVAQLEGLITRPDTLGPCKAADFVYESLYSLGESFDDFFVEKTRTAEWLTLRCKLVESPFFQYPEIEQGHIYEGKAPIATVLAAREELLQFWRSTAPRISAGNGQVG